MLLSKNDTREGMVTLENHQVGVLDPIINVQTAPSSENMVEQLGKRYNKDDIRTFFHGVKGMNDKGDDGVEYSGAVTEVWTRGTDVTGARVREMLTVFTMVVSLTTVQGH